MPFYLQAFLVFFKIGAFTIGGGYAMIPLIQEEIVTKKKWMSEEDFLDLLALAQSLPGILAVNIAIYVGEKLRGYRCSLLTALGAVLPSFCIVLLIAAFFAQFEDNITVQHIFKGIRPAVVALITAPAFQLSRTCKIGLRNVWIPVISALAIFLFGISPVWVIAVTGLGGIAYGYYQKQKSMNPKNS